MSPIKKLVYISHLEMKQLAYLSSNFSDVLFVDLANPKTNRRNAGFSDEEREGFTNLLKEGFVDTFRHLHAEVTGAYTFWTFMGNARARNVGWSVAEFLVEIMHHYIIVYYYKIIIFSCHFIP